MENNRPQAKSYVPQEDNVPTWNYAAVHIEAKLQIVTDSSEALQILKEQVDWWEANLGTNWKLDVKLPSIQDLGKGIVAFPVRISRWFFYL